MNRHKSVERQRMAALLLVLSFTLVSGPLAAHAQVYLYGRSDFQATSNPSNLVVADFNGDGRPDMAVTSYYNNWVSILLATGNGGFTLSRTYPTGSGSAALVAADFNGDKKNDLAILNQNSGTISVLLGNGDGTFQTHVDYPVGDNPTAIVAGDFNGDGKIDLATIDTSDSAIAILLGNGDGSFEVQALIPVASEPVALAAGHVSGDGKTDLMVCNSDYSTTGTITVLISEGGGTFKQVNSQAPMYASALTLGDFNGDGKLDALVEAEGLYLSLGNGDGTFQNPVPITNVPYLYDQGLLAGDFNHDGKLDLAYSGVSVLLGNGDGTFQSPILSAAIATPMAVLDVNGDGEPDLVTVTNSGAVAVLLGNGDGTFMDVRNVALAPTPYYPIVGIAADFNGDGKLDLAVAETNYSNGQVSVELGKGNGTFRQPIVSAFSATAVGPTQMLAADFNGDGKPDLAALDDNGEGFQVLLGRGDGMFETAVDHPLTYSIISFAAGDFNKDGKSDLVVTTGYGSSPTLGIYLSRGDGTFSFGAGYVVYPYSDVTVADVNGDGNLDLVVVSTNNGSYSVLIFLGHGDGTFSDPILGPGDNYNTQAATGDFNRDGKLDLAIGTSSGIAFLPGNGDGTFGTEVYSNPGMQFSSGLIAADFNGDSKPDVAAPGGYSVSGPVIMVGNGDGTFGPPLEYDAYSNEYQLGPIAGDFNLDGVSDFGIIGALSTTNAPTVFLYLSRPTPDLFPTALSFGTESVGKTSAPKKVKLTNIGNSRLRISGITATGDFVEQNNCSLGLAVGRSCVIQVSFKPSAKGIRTGQVSITDNAPGHVQPVILKGTGD